MHDLITRLQALSSAEDFLDFFGLPYEPSVVHVNRLHILKRFHQYLGREAGAEADDEVATFRRYRELLATAYGDFVHSTPQREKVFKVFQEAGGTRRVGLETLRDSLAERRRAAA